VNEIIYAFLSTTREGETSLAAAGTVETISAIDAPEGRRYFE
jgi:hypothetical protein